MVEVLWSVEVSRAASLLCVAHERTELQRRMKRSFRITLIEPSGDLSCSVDISSLRVCAEHFLKARCCAGIRQSLFWWRSAAPVGVRPGGAP